MSVSYYGCYLNSSYFCLISKLFKDSLKIVLGKSY